MKRITALFLTLTLLCTIPACQTTPVEPIVVQKDMERMIETALQTPVLPVNTSLKDSEEIPTAISPLYQKLGAPQTYQAEFVTRTDKLQITVDTVVQLPNTTGMPIARVRPTQFTQEQATVFFNLLCGDTPMYDAGPSGFTRAELDENILMYQERVRSDSSDKKAKTMLQYLEEQRALIPENMEEYRSKGILREMTFSFGAPDLGRYMGVHATENPLSFRQPGMGFCVRNDMNVMDWGNENIDWGEEIGARMGFTNPAHAPDIDSYRPVYSLILNESAVPEQAKGTLSLTPAQARAQVDGLLRQTGCGFVTENIYLYERMPHQKDGQPIKPSDFSYVINCGSEICGLPVRNVQEAQSNNYKTETSMAPSWFYERMEWEVTDQGVCGFSWLAPMEVTEIVTEDAALMPFSDIAEIFKRMLLIKYEGAAENEDLIKQEITIDRIALELQRATEPDAVNGGVVIPVWNFYGDINYQYTFDWDPGSNELPQSLLTINAIDGSVIDPGRGY